MIKTLRITTIVAAFLAVIFFVLPVVFGGRSDKKIEQFLNSAGIVEQYNKATDNKEKTSQNQISPLITQAEAFAKYLNPPPKPKPATPIVPKPAVSPPKPRGPVTAKFTLVGTSVHEAQPELSLAFINEPGKGLRWIRQGSQVEHITIQQVKDGIVVVQDGQRTFEIAAQQKPERSLLESPSPAPVFRQEDAGATTTNTPTPSTVAEGMAMLEEFLESVQAHIESGEINIPDTENPPSDFGKMRISDDEAEKLQRLPKKLDPSRRRLTEPEQDTQQSTGHITAEPNQVKSRLDGAKPTTIRKFRRPERPRGPNLPRRRR